MFRRILTVGLVFTFSLPQTRAADKWWKGAAGTANNTSADWYPSDAVTTLTTLATTDRAIFSVGASAAAFTISGTPTATGGLTVEDGTVTIGATWGSFGTAPLQVNSGATLVISVSTSIPTTPGSVLTLNGGRMRNSNASTTGSFIDVDTTITLGAGGGIISGTGGAAAQTIIQTNSIISGTGPLTKDGNASIALVSPCTYSGATIINDGTLRIRLFSNRLPIGTDVTVNSPGTLDPGSTSDTIQQVNSINGNGNITFSANSTLLIAGSGDSTLTGLISDGAAFGRISKQGAGTLTLSGLNTYDGRFTNNAGTTTITSGGAWCGPACDIYMNGGIVNLNNTAQTILSLAGTGGTINLASGHTLTINPGSGVKTNSGTIAGLGAISKTGAGTTAFAGNNSYTGNTTVSGGGELQVNSANALGSTDGYTEVAIGAEVLFTGVATSFTCPENFRIAGGGSGDGGAISIIASASPTLSGTITLTGDATNAVSGSSQVTYSNPNAFTSLANQNLTLQGGSGAGGGGNISGIIALGSGGLTKLQGGTWRLSGVNTYTGPTTVSAGTLLINSPGSLAAGSVVSVSSGATLGGNGTINGALTVNTGGTLAPGASIGTLTLAAPPALSGATSMEVDRNGGSPLADKVVVSSGTFAYGGTLTLVNVGAAYVAGDTFDLFDASSFSGSFSSISPATPGAGLLWNTANLAVDGTLGVVVANTPPTALDASYPRTQNLTLKIGIADLLATYTTDADGHPRSLQSVGSSAQGATITTSSTHIFYTPVNNNNDSFTYTINDGQGGMDTATITITVVNPGGLVQTITSSGDSVTINFAGIPGYQYNIQRSSDPGGPWTTVDTQTAPANGLFSYSEIPPGSPSFYRLIQP